MDGEDLCEAVEGGGAEPVEVGAGFCVVSDNKGVVGSGEGEGFGGVDGVVEVEEEVSGGDVELVEGEVAADVGEDEDAGGAGREGEEGAEWVVEGGLGGRARARRSGREDDVSVHGNCELRIGELARRGRGEGIERERPLPLRKLFFEILKALCCVFESLLFVSRSHEAKDVSLPIFDFHVRARAFHSCIEAVTQQAAVGALLQFFSHNGVNICARRQIQFFNDGCFVVDTLDSSGFDKSNAGRQIFGKGGSEFGDRFEECGFTSIKYRIQLRRRNLSYAFCFCSCRLWNLRR